ncbi:hypothetical protein [Eleftheria terrae]|uniref:hypothetical protein n=1 Tax=Eleftheria terrae TaxID=1597781 RepID=UPI00263A6F40|nr:hypothetical protein [Eleftheria terrae]WKB56118.1 hypothetical protein N7L95_29150 [Eleftheria terrae]
MPIRRSLQFIAILVVLMVCGRFGAALYLFSLEDYSPVPGSLTYYLGLSSFIRHTPVPSDALTVKYFGSVGDGTKLPQSEVSYQVDVSKADAAWADMKRYADESGFSYKAGGLDASEQHDATLVKKAEFSSPHEGALTLTLTHDLATQALRLHMTHYD